MTQNGRRSTSPRPDRATPGLNQKPPSVSAAPASAARTARAGCRGRRRRPACAGRRGRREATRPAESRARSRRRSSCCSCSRVVAHVFGLDVEVEPPRRHAAPPGRARTHCVAAPGAAEQRRQLPGDLFAAGEGPADERRACADRLVVVSGLEVQRAAIGDRDRRGVVCRRRERRSDRR